MKAFTLLIFLLFMLSVCGTAQDTSLLKRIPYHLVVAVNKDAAYEEDIKASNYVLPDNTIQLYPGESIHVVVEQEAGIIKNITAVPEIRDSLKTLTISFTQVKKGNIHQSMMLSINNPFKKDLIYKATIFLMNQKKWVVTDVFPIKAGLSAYETWPDVIISIAVGNLEFATK